METQENEQLPLLLDVLVEKQTNEKFGTGNTNREDGWKIGKTQLPIIRQEEKRRETKKENITTEEVKNATNKNFRCRKKGQNANNVNHNTDRNNANST